MDRVAVVSRSSGQTVAPSGAAPGWRQWTALWVLALGTRLAAAFLLPNAEQDGYSYVLIIRNWTEKIAMGRFHLSDLFGFWLPLYQLVVAVPNLVIGNPLLLGKMVDAICGAISCVLVFAIARALSRSAALALAAFALVLAAPLHILYSAAAMTDVPYLTLVLASLCFVLREQWTTAAVLAAVAGFVRLEPWALIAVIPVVQWSRERKLPLLTVSIMLLPPIAWLALSWLATGDLWSYFTERVKYQDAYMQFHPSRFGFAMADVAVDWRYFLLGANRFVFAGMVLAGAVLVHDFWRRPDRFSWRAAATAFYGCAIVAFLVAGYVTKRQPVILPRYTLVLFVLGLPLLAWLLGQMSEHWRSSRPTLVATIVLALCLLDSLRQQLPTLWKVRGDYAAHEQVALALRSAMQESPPTAHCFADNPGVQVLSALPPSRFLDTEVTPPFARVSREAFITWLRANEVRYVVFFATENSLPATFLPELAKSDTINADGFERLVYASSTFGPDIALYRWRFP
jgi:hypothetical protein